METAAQQHQSRIWEQQARLFQLAGEPTRLRILGHLLDTKRACVSDIAKALDCSIACISHHLQLLRDSGILVAERERNTICYSVSATPFTRQLGSMLKHKGRTSR